MKATTKKYLILGVLVIAVCGVIAMKSLQTHEVAAGMADDSVIGGGKPVLLELGSHSCIPCKKMMPVLAVTLYFWSTVAVDYHQARP